MLLAAAVAPTASGNGTLGVVLQFLEVFAAAGGLTYAINAVRAWRKTKAQDEQVRSTVLPDASGRGGILADIGGVKGDVSQLKTDVGELKTDMGQLRDDVRTLKPNGGDTNNLGDLVFNMNKKLDKLVADKEAP